MRNKEEVVITIYGGDNCLDRKVIGRIEVDVIENDGIYYSDEKLVFKHTVGECPLWFNLVTVTVPRSLPASCDPITGKPREIELPWSYPERAIPPGGKVTVEFKQELFRLNGRIRHGTDEG